MVKTAVDAASAALREQGAVYPNAGAALVLKAVEAAGYAIVQLPEPDTDLSRFRWSSSTCLAAWGETSAWDDGRIFALSEFTRPPQGHVRLTVEQARTTAALLLAAANAVGGGVVSGHTPEPELADDWYRKHLAPISDTWRDRLSYWLYALADWVVGDNCHEVVVRDELGRRVCSVCARVPTIAVPEPPFSVWCCDGRIDDGVGGVR
jgi:hypothetical protein